MSRWRCGAPARATCSASIPATTSDPGSANRRSPARRKRSRAPSIRRDGSACPRATAQKARGCTTGRHDWAYCELADLDAAEYDDARTGLWTRGLLIRRNIADGDSAFFSTWCPAGTGIEMLVKIEGHRWAEVVKVPPACRWNTTGGDRGQLRDREERVGARPQRLSCEADRPLLARLASPRLARHARLRHDGRHSASCKHRDAPKKTAQDDEHLPPPLIRWSVQEIRRIAVRLARRRIQPANIIAWSLWRRAHQASARIIGTLFLKGFGLYLIACSVLVRYGLSVFAHLGSAVTRAAGEE